LNNKFIKIDDLVIDDHHYLDENDVCYYIGEYSAKKGYSYSETNSLILNFKKSVDKQNTPQWQYKKHAIKKAADIFLHNFNPQAQVTFVPIPPSKSKLDPLYDDRIVRMLNLVCLSMTSSDVRELVVLKESTQAAHECANNRPPPEELIANYCIDDKLINPPPKSIFIVDDVLTTGCHYKAVKQMLTQAFDSVPIYGIFIARRALP